MKNLSTCIILLFFCFSSMAQAFKATYEYDANGNRTKAYVIYLQTSLKSAKVPIDSLIAGQQIQVEDTVGLPKDGWDKGFTDNSSEFTASIYPNPTHGILIIELLSAENTNTTANSLSVWNMRGIEVFRLIKPNAFNRVDFSNMPVGIYVVKISINGTIKQYKVVKN